MYPCSYCIPLIRLAPQKQPDPPENPIDISGLPWAEFKRQSCVFFMKSICLSCSRRRAQYSQHTWCRPTNLLTMQMSHGISTMVHNMLRLAVAVRSCCLESTVTRRPTRSPGGATTSPAWEATAQGDIFMLTYIYHHTSSTWRWGGTAWCLFLVSGCFFFGGRCHFIIHYPIMCQQTPLNSLNLRKYRKHYLL